MVLLWGEYGLLLGLPGVAVTLPAFRMEISCSLRLAKKEPLIQIQSSFLEEGQLVLRDSTGVGFFQSLLFPYQDVLTHFRQEGYDLILTVTKNLPPDLGMGSSSALFAGVQVFLFSFLCTAPPLEAPPFFARLREGIHRWQGSGSGYDAVLQIAAQEDSHSRMWQYCWRSNASQPTFSRLPSSSETPLSYGTILKTGVYAETKAALQKFAQKDAVSFAQAQGALAHRFLQDPRPDSLIDLVREAQHLQEQQGLLPDIPFLQHLRAAHVPFKSLGAGFGDCVWSPWPATALQAFQENIVTEILLS
ncbi:MAG: hypothetical protein LBF76_02385 [Holosporales bacterium]|jgi:mevalonate kinase|nr:hypothetical protein [Holosporales bacterium]